MKTSNQSPLDLPDLGNLYQPTSDQSMTTAELEQKRELVKNSLNTLHAGMATIGALMADQPKDADCDLVDVGHLLQNLGRLALRLQASGANIDAVMAKHTG
ncbi:MAG: hypothetical protein KUF74_03560 [Candidatus Thiodiazotropha sp. (ex Ctena orbiculata)]|nr:hypothetical protein [Candidatus Thiodiazotropha taylori]